MYESAHFISSRKLSGFFDHPMPDSYPDYPSHRQILDYTREFAATHGLRDQIRFGTAVTESEHDGDRWTVGTGRRVPAHLPGPGLRYRHHLVTSDADAFPVSSPARCGTR